VSDYFRRGSVPVMTPRELFDFVVHLSLPTEAEEDAYLEQVSAFYIMLLLSASVCSAVNCASASNVT